MRRSSLTPGISYQETVGRYRSADGRFVSGQQVRAALDTALDNASKSVATLAERLRAGGLSVADWQTAMAREVKSAHLASSSLAKGGWAQMSQADYGRAGQKIRGQYAYLRGFAEQIASGAQRLDGTLARRAEMYIQAGRNTYHAVEQREQERRGMLEESNVLAPGDSCAGCLDADALGWVPIGSLPPVGTRDCLTNCRCEISYR